MPQIYVPKELYDKLTQQGEDAAAFIVRAAETEMDRLVLLKQELAQKAARREGK